MSPRTKKWLIIGSALKLVVTVVLIIVFVFLPSSSVDHRLLATDSGREIGAYSASLLQLHDNGAFNVTIIHDETIYFSAVGTFNRSRNNLRLYFTDAWIRSGDIMTRNLSLLDTSPDFAITNNRIRLTLNGTAYYFRA